LAFTQRHLMGNLAFDPAYGAMTALPPPYILYPDAYYLQWKSPQWSAIVGTYQASFGERLTFSSSSRRKHTNGFYTDNAFKKVFGVNDVVSGCNFSVIDANGDEVCPPGEDLVKGTPDFETRNRLRGVAATLHNVPFGNDLHLSGTVFGSYQNHNLYQYETF